MVRILKTNKNIKMKTFKNIKLILTSLLLSMVFFAQAQDFTAITNSLKVGDVKSFSQHFDTNLELTILDNEAIYSKEQIVTILKDFFSKNKPSAYTLIHKGNSGNGAYFQIGELFTSTDKFRTYLYAKNINGRFLIQEFRIEKN